MGGDLARDTDVPSLDVTLAESPKALAAPVPPGVHDMTTMVGSATKQAIVTPEDIVYGAEVRRSRVFAAFACAIAAAASLMVLFMPGDRIAKYVLWGGCGVLIAGGVAWLWRLRNPANYKPSEGAIFGYLAIIAIGGGFFYFGPFSAAAMLVSIGGFMFSLGQSRRAVIIMASLACLMHGTIGGLVVESACHYHAPVAYPTPLRAGLRVDRLGQRAVTYGLAIFREGDDAAVAHGHFVHVFVDRATRTPTPIPDNLRAALERLVIA